MHLDQMGKSFTHLPVSPSFYPSKDEKHRDAMRHKETKKAQSPGRMGFIIGA
jgi:hypothetical protein